MFWSLFCESLVKYDNDVMEIEIAIEHGDNELKIGRMDAYKRNETPADKPNVGEHETTAFPSNNDVCWWK